MSKIPTLNNDPDRISASKSVYDVTYKTLMWRNFLAGLSRGAGWFLFQLIFLLLLGALFAQYLLPTMQRLTASMFSVSQSLSAISETGVSVGDGLMNIFNPLGNVTNWLQGEEQK